MGMRWQCISQSWVNDSSLRFDVDYIFENITRVDKYYRWNELFEFVSYQKINLEELDDFQYAEIGNVNNNGSVLPITLSFSNRNEVNENYFIKIEKGDIIKPENGDILISSVRPYLNKNVLIENDNIYFTSAFIHIRPKIDSEILYYLLRTTLFKQLNAVSRQGKGYPTLKEDDIKLIRFQKYIIDTILANKDSIKSKILTILQRIKRLQSQSLEPLSVINKIFAVEFKFDLHAFEKEKKQRLQILNLSDFANNKDLRCGIRFHNPAYKFLHKYLTGLFRTKIKDFISEPIVLGKGISPNDYDEEGKYYYISMADIKNWYFNQEECKTVGDEFYRSNFNKSFAMNDIIMARSGEGTIGKVAIIQDEEIEGLFADFTMRIRLRNYNPLLAYYYFRSDFFQYYIYTHKKGLGNNTNIFPSQVWEFPIPDFSEKKQKSIVEKIKSELDKQKEIEREIDEKQKEISRIIEAAIKG